MKRIIYSHLPSTCIYGVSFSHGHISGGMQLVFDFGSRSLCFVIKHQREGWERVLENGN